MTAVATVQRPASGDVRITVREGWSRIVGLIVFVLVIAAALYTLMPEARSAPAPLAGLLAAGLGWAAIARSAREEYLIDGATRSVTARHTWLLGRGEVTVRRGEVDLVRLAIGGPDDDRRLVELVAGRTVRLRLPRRVNTLSEHDQRSIGRLIAEHLAVPLEAA